MTKKDEQQKTETQDKPQYTKPKIIATYSKQELERALSSSRVMGYTDTWSGTG